MADLNAYLGWNPSGDLEEWAAQASRDGGIDLMLGHRGVSVVIRRGDANLSSQTLLIAPAGRNSNSSERSSDSGQSATEQLLLVGMATADLRKNDRFMYPASAGRLNYEVKRVERSLFGMIQAFAEEIQ
jgi:hypothetical protein